MILNQLHKSDIGAPLKGSINFPPPLGPLWVTRMGQVSALQLQAVLYEAGYNPPAVQAWVPTHLVAEPFSITNKAHAAAYGQALSSYLGFKEGYLDTLSTQDVTYFMAQAKFDRRAAVAAVLGGPGLFMPYALAYINKALTNKRGPYMTWAHALDIAAKPIDRNALVAQVVALVPALSVQQLQQLLDTYGPPPSPSPS